MKKYITPEAELLLLQVEDTLAASNPILSGDKSSVADRDPVTDFGSVDLW